MSFEDGLFDAVFSNGSLHEWAHPGEILNEIGRVLKPDGRYMVSDLRRDMNPLMKWFIWAMTSPKEMRAGFRTSVMASYTLPEVEALLSRATLPNWRVTKNVVGIVIRGRKPVPSEAEPAGTEVGAS